MLKSLLLIAPLVWNVALNQEAPSPGRATIDGAGLSRPIRLGGQPFFDLVYLSGLVRDWSPPPPGEPVLPAPDLGPRLLIRYTFQAPGGSIRVRQHLYLSNGRAAWTYTPPGQQIAVAGDKTVVAPSGWWRSRILGEFLSAVGLQRAVLNPVTDVIEAVGVAERPADGASQGVPPSSVGVGLAALALLLLAAALAGRTQQTARP